MEDFKAWQRGLSSCRPSQNEHDQGAIGVENLTQSDFSKMLKNHVLFMEHDRQYNLAVFHKDSSTHLGGMTVTINARSSFQSGYISFYIHNNHWRKGYGSEAVKATLEICFEQLRLFRIEATVLENNTASRSVLEKAKFQCEGLKHKFQHNGEEWMDVMIYSTRADLWGYDDLKPEIRWNAKEELINPT